MVSRDPSGWLFEHLVDLFQGGGSNNLSWALQENGRAVHLSEREAKPSQYAVHTGQIYKCKKWGCTKRGPKVAVRRHEEEAVRRPVEAVHAVGKAVGGNERKYTDYSAGYDSVTDFIAARCFACDSPSHFKPFQAHAVHLQVGRTWAAASGHRYGDFFTAASHSDLRLLPRGYCASTRCSHLHSCVV
eukprot:SM000043S15812  [mRNA]  locus=s43:202272:202857:- [translate_table: standard]